jgi:BirA family transcriptional regulator, biotin operon repressor / biotin---[acetyl-CoA-carboxylase] ligase
MAHSVSVVKGGRFVIDKIISTIPTQPDNATTEAIDEAIRTEAIRTEAISLEKIQAAIATNNTDLGVMSEFRQIRPQFNVHVFESLPSTNTQLWQMMSQGAGAGTVAIAQQQSSGRGQRGRTWCSEPGGLYLSLALEPDWPVTHSAQLTCMSAWGIAVAFNNLGLPIRIKWPNDLFFEGQKLGGILTETKLAQPIAHSSALGSCSGAPTGAPTRIKQAVIGVGINWHNPVPETAITLSKILELMPESAAKNKINCLEMLAALVLKGILQGYFFQQRVGSQVFMKTYSDLLTQVGEIVSLDKNLLDRAVLNEQMKTQLVNRSGEIIGVSEEGYLKVAVLEATKSTPLEKLADPSKLAPSKRLGCISDVLLFKPSETYMG